MCQAWGYVPILIILQAKSTFFILQEKQLKFRDVNWFVGN